LASRDAIVWMIPKQGFWVASTATAVSDVVFVGRRIVCAVPEN